MRMGLNMPKSISVRLDNTGPTNLVPKLCILRVHTKRVMQPPRFLEGFLEGSLAASAS